MMSMLGRDTFRMELYAINGQFPMLKPLDDAVRTFSGYLQAIG